MKTQSLQLSIISGVVGVMLGAGSMYVVNASVIQPHHEHGAAIEQSDRDRQSVRSLNQDALVNDRSDTGKRPNNVRGKGY